MSKLVHLGARKFSISKVSSTSRVLVAFVAGAVAAGGVAYAASQPSAAPINACRDKKSGALRIPPNGQCKTTEITLSWNSVGQPGPQGNTGPAVYVHSDGAAIATADSDAIWLATSGARNIANYAGATGCEICSTLPGGKRIVLRDVFTLRQESAVWLALVDGKCSSSSTPSFDDPRWMYFPSGTRDIPLGSSAQGKCAVLSYQAPNYSLIDGGVVLQIVP